jgi:hypothetical protein
LLGCEILSKADLLVLSIPDGKDVVVALKFAKQELAAYGLAVVGVP